ncbi:SGNH/GDSL hydrolase family protein [Caulobacter segnis]|uniref:Lipolytic protein G-D-S-L family n=2 Tax=Caulobacter segnis TaxID=88688 RepID=D5VL13_CAUST|nr:SGNH/GDSL hydrolase family protein [Caulobacter segnis]ADG11186.1 lipolytic protein G-D-S-L family [Caulobacter segnis ATCC 21756]AVQ02867.1 SGNH/GDSL hydrolase family protein [Caulobacter segnis]
MKLLRAGLPLAAIAAVLIAGPGFAAPKPKPAIVAAPLSTWSAAWGIAPLQSVAVARPNEVRLFSDVTARQVVRLNLGGDAIRLRLTNELSERTLKVGAMSVALASADGKIQGAPIAVTFGGKPEASIAPGAPLLSDPIALPAKAMDHLSVATFFVEPTAPAGHRVRLFLSPQGNHTAKTEIPGEQATRGPGLISGVEVRGVSQRPVIAAIGDSITEGARSTPDADMGWPEQLAARIAARGDAFGVVNVGISGGRLLREGSGPSALTRFDRDVLSIPGLSGVVVLEGINDIGRAAQPGYASEAVTADELIAGYRQLIARAHARGVKVYGGTLLPFEGAMYFHAAGETTRQAVNGWIRNSGEFDGVIDFEAAMKDPAKPSRMLEGLHSGDFLHPGDAGYARMAEVADKALFGAR